MTRLFPVILLLLVVGSAVAGWYSVPHYRPPADDGEARLRERASEFYKASRLFDFRTMSQLFSPARQQSDQDELLNDTEKKSNMFSQLDAESQQNLWVSADSITPESLTVELDGDWATTSGMCAYPVGESTIKIDLEKLVWIRTGGDWWIYTWKWPEIAAYGNPSLENMELLRERKIADARRVALEYQQEQQKQLEQQSGGEEGDAADAETDGEPPLETGGSDQAEPGSGD